MFKPSFTGVVLDGDTVTVSGETDGTAATTGLADVIDIAVVLVQGTRVGRTSTLAPPAGFGFKFDEVWEADLPVDGGDQPDFEPGSAIAFGVETRIENRTTVSWSENVTIESATKSGPV